MQLRVLILEDQVADAELMARALRQTGFGIEWQCVDTEKAYRTALGSAPDVILSDHSLPQFGALEALRLLQERGMDTPFIVVTGTMEDEVAVECGDTLT